MIFERNLGGHYNGIKLFVFILIVIFAVLILTGGFESQVIKDIGKNLTNSLNNLQGYKIAGLIIFISIIVYVAFRLHIYSKSKKIHIN